MTPSSYWIGTSPSGQVGQEGQNMELHLLGGLSPSHLGIPNLVVLVGRRYADYCLCVSKLMRLTISLVMTFENCVAIQKLKCTRLLCTMHH